MKITNHKDPNYLGKVNIPLNIVVISLMLAGVLTLIHFWIHKNYKEYKDTLPFTVNTFATSAGALSAYYAYRSLRQAEKDKKQDKAYHLIERWNSPELLPLEFDAKQIINDLRKNQQSMEVYIQEAEENNNQNQEKIHKVTKILNFLVEIAICIENGIADEDVLKSFFRGIVQDYCEKFDDLIHSRRKGNGHQERYKKLLELANQWNGSGKIT
ncbi:MAG: DUF4760 domain-containing protein [Cyanobacteriota bacterium]|nr:DUF4760 domain-containing protein [Cyanobacteriota bacterium]